MDLVIWSQKNEGSSCVLEPPAGIDRAWELKEGVPRLATFPPDARFRMSDDHKRNIGLTDNLINLSGLAVISERLKNFLEGRSLKNVEYLPVTIVNHKKRQVKEPYFILHAVIPQDCLDVQKSGCSYNAIIPTDINNVKALVIEPARLDPDVRLFRLKDFGAPLLISRDLAGEILKGGFRGVSFIELQDYGS
jgi:hypothetical protein